MKIVFNCCTKPAKYSHNAGVTLFKGEKPETVVKSEVKPSLQPAVDTFTVSTPKAAEQTAVKIEAKQEVKPAIKPEVAAGK